MTYVFRVGTCLIIFTISIIINNVVIRYNEVCSDENTFSESPSDDLTEFNQLVSKTTEKLGIGRANFDREGKYCTVIVARYYPGLDKNSVRGNVIEGIFDRKSYCNGLGALVDTANGNGYNKRSNGITDELTINVRGKSILILCACKKEFNKLLRSFS